MKIDSMRKLDFYLGIPLCWLMTIPLKIISLFNKSKNTPPKKILFIELSEMGSTIIADPCMRKAKTHFKAEIFFLIFKKNKESLYILNTIPKNNIFSIREDNFWYLIVDVINFIIWSKKKKIDTCFDLELFSRFSALLSVLSGSKNRIGFDAFYNEGLSRGRLLTHRVIYNNHIHMAKNFISLINALINNHEIPFSKTIITDSEIKLIQPRISLDKKEMIYNKIKALSHLYEPDVNQIILINPNSSELLPQRCWPKKHFKSLIESILKEYSKTIILITGNKSEKKTAQELCESINNTRCINFANEVEFRDLIALYHCSKLMISNDSGPGHFSAVTPLKTIILFGPETPTLYGSLGNSIPLFSGLACSPCVSAANHRKTPCQNNICMQLLEPEVVMETVRNFLNQ